MEICSLGWKYGRNLWNSGLDLMYRDERKFYDREEAKRREHKPAESKSKENFSTSRKNIFLFTFQRLKVCVRAREFQGNSVSGESI